MAHHQIFFPTGPKTPPVSLPGDTLGDAHLPLFGHVLGSLRDSDSGELPPQTPSLRPHSETAPRKALSGCLQLPLGRSAPLLPVCCCPLSRMCPTERLSQPLSSRLVPCNELALGCHLCQISMKMPLEILACSKHSSHVTTSPAQLATPQRSRLCAAPRPGHPEQLGCAACKCCHGFIMFP